MKTGGFGKRTGWMAMGVIAGGLLAGPLQALEVVKIEPLGYPDWLGAEAEFQVAIRGISGDGSVLAAHSLWDGRSVYSWNNGVWSNLADVPEPYSDIFLYGMSSDASVFLGVFSNPPDHYEACKIEDGVVTGLGDLSGGKIASYPSAASDDGSVIVGWGINSISEEAFRWEDGVMAGLGSGSFNASWALDVSGDGSLILGELFDETSGYWYGAIYDYSATEPGWIVLGVPEGETHENAFFSASAISNDGSTVIGSVSIGPVARQYPYPAVCFLSDGQPVETVALPLYPGATLSEVVDISADGSLIVGYSFFSNEDDRAVTFWEREGGQYNPTLALKLSDITNTDGLWEISFENSLLSADGSTLVVRVRVSEDIGGSGPVASNFLLTLAANKWGPYTVRSDGYCDTTPWMGWLWVDTGPWVWCVDMNHWIYCPVENVGESGGWVYVPK
ncbi:MAG: hypothetical protein AB3N33_12595 [Puniceicoccaceae bacterium]